MTRNELVLAVLKVGDASTAQIARLTGLNERACRARLRYLKNEGLSWSPERAVHRLTPRGRAVAADLPALNEQPPGEAVPAVPDGPPGSRLLRRRRH